MAGIWGLEGSWGKKKNLPEGGGTGWLKGGEEGGVGGTQKKVGGKGDQKDFQNNSWGIMGQFGKSQRRLKIIGGNKATKFRRKIPRVARETSHRHYQEQERTVPPTWVRRGKGGLQDGGWERVW